MLRRGWQAEHGSLARYDIVIGLVVPYLIVTALVSIAAAAALHGGDLDYQTRISPAQAGAMFVAAGIGDVVGRLVFPLGVLGMAVGSLVMHMLTCGAAAMEMFNLREGSAAYRWACLLPTPAVLGVFLWTSMGPYVILADIGFLRAAVAHRLRWLADSQQPGVVSRRPPSPGWSGRAVQWRDDRLYRDRHGERRL